MLFDNLIGEEGASTTAVLPSDLEPESSLSFMLWVRFHKDQKETADAVLLKLGGIIQVKNNTIIFTNATNFHTVNTVAFGHPIRLDDGAWHFIVVSWKQNGETLVHVDNILISNENSVSGSLPNMLNVEVGRKFGGRLSQVKIWSNSLNRNDMFQLFNNKDFQSAGSTVVHGWYNYKMSKGVLKKIPSRIKNGQVCDVPACSNSDKIKPNIKSCAADVSGYSSSGIFYYQLPSFISMFDDFNESLSLSSYPKDNFYTWGCYNLLFMASDENGNTAMCHSKLYVKYNPDCPSPRTYSPTLIKYCSSSKDICKFECPGNQQHSPPAPRYKMCSELGVYDQLNPRRRFLVPSCANASKVNVEVEVSLRYVFVVTCSPVFETSMRSSLLTAFKDFVYNNWNGVCTTSDCNNMEILCTCVPESKQMIVTLQLNNLRHTITRKENGSDTYTPKEVFMYLIAEETVFQAEHIGGATMMNEHLFIKDILWCPEDYMVIGNNCVECSIGTFFNSTSHNCEYCPIGTYGDQYGLKACKPCEIGKTTLGLGNTDSTDCVDDCPVGQFWNVTKCAYCKKQFYQDMTGQDYCFICPLDRTTGGVGSNSSLQCNETREASTFPSTTSGEVTTNADEILDNSTGKKNTDDSDFNPFIVILTISGLIIVILLTVIGILLRRRFQKTALKNSNYTNQTLEVQEPDKHSYSQLNVLNENFEYDENGGYWELDSIHQVDTVSAHVEGTRTDYENDTERQLSDEPHVYTDVHVE